MFGKILTTAVSDCKILIVKPQFTLFSGGKMTNIQIKISGKIAVCRKRYLVSSNSDYTVTFDFDEEWKNHTVKTARFIFDSKSVDIPFSGDSVAVPKIPACRSLGIGVFSDSVSSTVAEIGCVLSAADFDGEKGEELTESQYDRLFALVNSLAEKKDDNVVFFERSDGISLFGSALKILDAENITQSGSSLRIGG